MSMPTHCALTRCYTIWPELLVVNETCTGERNSDYRSFRQFEEEIVEGMRKYGVLETLDVFKTTNDSGELVYEVSKGRQRTINVCEANERDRAWYSNNDQELKPEWIKQAPGRNNAEREKNLHEAIENNMGPWRAPISFESASDLEAFERNVISNEHRVPETAVSRGYKIVDYCDRLGKTKQDAAKLWGVSVQSINKWIKTTELAQEVQDAIEEGEVSLEKAVRWHGLSEKDQLLELAAHLEKAPKKGKRTKKRPGPKTLQKLLKEDDKAELLPHEARVILEWVMGDMTSETAKGELPELSELFERIGK